MADIGYCVTCRRLADPQFNATHSESHTVSFAVFANCYFCDVAVVDVDRLINVYNIMVLHCSLLLIKWINSSNKNAQSKVTTGCTTRADFHGGNLMWVAVVSSSSAVGVKTLRTQDTSDLRHFGTTVMVPKCPDISAPSSIVCSQKESYTHTIKLITHIMSHVCTTNKWNKPASTISCDSIVLCSYYF